MNKRRFIEQASGEEYVHKAVWRVANRQLVHAKTETKGAQLDDLVAMVFASHALEGYANFLGGKSPLTCGRASGSVSRKRAWPES
jgi:gamma-glutamylcysteine synthetase